MSDHYRMHEIDRVVDAQDPAEPLRLQIRGINGPEGRRGEHTRWLNVSLPEAVAIARMLDANDNEEE